jgi:integrase
MELKRHKLASPVSELDLVYSNSDGKPLEPDNLIKREFLPALRRAKIRRVRFHDLRHTNASMRIEEGQNIVYISRQIGHGSVKTTLDIYGHMMKEVNSEQAKKLENILGFTEQSDSSSVDDGRKMVEMDIKKDSRRTVSL